MLRFLSSTVDFETLYCVERFLYAVKSRCK
nr:MAG TPA: hypothetical protein [Caudoviricetes sp.]